jgi:hypothetical protein
MISPPKHIPAKRVFRLLSGVPRPLLEIEYRIEEAKNIQLFVQGLRGVEEAAALDAVEGIANEEAKYSSLAAELIQKSLLTSRGPAFYSVNDVLKLKEYSLKPLWVAVRKALGIVSPTYSNANVIQWKFFLKEGASSHGNIVEAMKMSSCDAQEYYGLPMREVTDGQLIVFEAARDYFNERRGE